MKQVLIDSDVILDFLLEREPFSSDASKVLALCANSIIKGFVTPVIVSNTFYILSKLISNKMAKSKIKTLLIDLDVLMMNKSIVIEALNSNFKDFEDALQYYSAVNNKEIDTIITRNIKDYKLSNIPIYTSTHYIKAFKTDIK